MRIARALTIVTAAVALTALAPAYAFGANAYGQVFAGQAKCLTCHGNVDGRWQTGTYVDTAHGRFVTEVQVATSALLPKPTSNLWPSPAMGGGISFAPKDLWFTLGAPDKLHEYVSRFRNDGTSTLTTGFRIGPIAGPSDDVLMFNPIGFEPEANIWEPEGPVSVRTYFQGCGGCHFLGLTRPGEKTVTLPNGAIQTPSTETSYSGFGIQCEHCHGTGSTRSNHWTTGVEIVRTKKALKSQVCGQCHVNASTNEKNFVGKAFGNANGYTPDRDLDDFLNVSGVQYVKPSRALPAPSIPAADTKFYPDGHNEGMHHSYYNEWLISGHARSLRYGNGDLWSADAKDSCLRCHSGEGFLKSIGYGSDGPNDIGVFPSRLANDTLNVECAVCHTVHAKTGDSLGLRLPEGKLCQACHNGGIRAGSEATAGAIVDHNQAEMLAGYGLIGVAKPARPFMRSTDCIDCHLPMTRETRLSHRFTAMLPGDAEDWGVQEDGDSCTPCHPSLSRQELQADIDGWQTDIRQEARQASEAIRAAAARPAATGGAGKKLLDCARTNLAFVEADGSEGVHAYPYAKAGLEKAEYFADAVGARFASFKLTSFDKRAGLAMAYGKLVLGDGSTRAGESVTIEAKPGGSSGWTRLGTAATSASGDFVFAVAPNVTTAYRARWSAKDDSTALTSGESSVVFGTSTSIRLTRATMAPRQTVGITGAVSPSHAGQYVTIQYHLGPYSWKTLTVRRLNSQSAYYFDWRAASRGTWYFRVIYGGDATHAASTSAVKAVQVR